MLLGGNEIRNAIDDEISRDDDRLRGEVDKKFKTHEVSDKYPRYNITKPNGEVSQIHFNNTSVPGSDAWHVYKDSLGRAKSWNDIVEPLVSVGGSLAIGGAGTVGALSKVDKLSKAKRIMDYMNMFGNALAPVSASYGRYVDNNIERNKDKYMQAADYVVGHKGVFPDQVAIDNLEKAVKYGDEYYQ
jgi:hypothetical protein